MVPTLNGDNVSVEGLSSVASGPKVSVCLVAHFAYGALVGGRAGHIGGVERQTSLMAKWLASRGHTASVLTWDEGQEDGAEIAGVRAFSICRQDAGLPGLRFVHPRWTGLVGAMARANAEVYYQNCGEVVTGQVALWCRRNGRRFVYSVAADADCHVALPLMTGRERVFYRIGLRRANCIVVQTEAQQGMLRAGFRLPSVVLPMPCPGPDETEFVRPAPPDPGQGRVLWLGRVVPEKRPDRLIELAQRCPDIHFDAVGPYGLDALTRGVLSEAAAIPNLTLHGPAPRERVDEFYRRVHCYCSTSDSEGFPNTYLEAWSHGVPVVALADPDGLIRKRHLGAVASDVDGLVAGIRQLLGDRQQWLAVSANARNYYLGRHTVDAAMTEFERVFQMEAMNVAVRRAEAEAR